MITIGKIKIGNAKQTQAQNFQEIDKHTTKAKVIVIGA
ncbi:Uncharacterised protein [Chlamydia trachomatis]|nr:Uncharacterised protein [Chlamydia trachomatis]